MDVDDLPTPEENRERVQKRLETEKTASGFDPDVQIAEEARDEREAEEEVKKEEEEEAKKSTPAKKAASKKVEL